MRLLLFLVFANRNFVVANVEKMSNENLTVVEMFERIIVRLDQLGASLDSLMKQRECFDGDTLLDNSDMCRLLNITKRTLARYRQKKLVRYYMIDRKVFYRASEVAEFMKISGRV